MTTLSQKIARALADLLRNAPQKDHPRIVRGFVVFLKKQQLLFRADNILGALSDALTKTTAKNIRIEIAHPIHMREAEATIDQDLLAGVRLSQDDYVVHASARNRLQQLKKSLTQS